MGTPTEGAGLEDSERFANEGSEGDDKSKGPGTAPDNAVRSGNKAEAEEAGVARGLQEDGQSLRNSSADSEETMERPNAGPAEARQHDSEPSTSSQTRPHGQDGEGDADKNDAIAALESRTKKVTLMDGDPGKIKFGEGTSATDGGGPPAERFEEGSYVREAYCPPGDWDKPLASPASSTGRGTAFKSGQRKDLGKSMQRSQFGRMVDSVKQSAPSIAFGSANRFSHGSIGYVPSGEGVPGPGCYETVKDLGKDMGSSEHSHHPAYHFGHDERFKGPGTSSLVRMPDPGKYDIPPSIGRQTLSTKESASPKSFVKATRNVKVSIGKGFEEDMYGLDAPGPGTYPTKSGFGTQAASEKSTSPNFGFGTNARAVGGGRSLEERKASELPGPGEYVSVSAVGPQVESSRPSKPAFPFGSAGRSGAAGKTGAPGPGAYKNEKSGFGAQLVSPKRSMPAVSFTSASRFPRSASERTPGPGSYCN